MPLSRVRRLRASWSAGVLAVLLASPAAAERPVDYRLSFPEPHHRWLQVEVTFPDLPPGPFEARMSRSSPGRYALHEFAKNVIDVAAADGAGRRLPVERTSPHTWRVAGHDGLVRLTYRLFGDRVDGTYLAVDTTHAHLNAPATLMWAAGLERRPARVTLTQPPGRSWTVATQLFPTGDPLAFRAPNLQYLLDSPIEFGEIAIRHFTVPTRPGGPETTIRVAMHHQGTDAELDRFVEVTRRIVLAQQAIFGELPDFEPGHFTFIVDALPWAHGDGMEHRNSTVITSPSSLAHAHTALVGTVAHEFFHVWNVERIRPRALEPFDFTGANPSRALWLAEGITSYVDRLSMHRAGVLDLEATLAWWSDAVDAVVRGPGRGFRGAAEMSVMAPLVDAARPVDRTNWENTYISYYTFGAAIGLGLDLTLRDRTDGRVTLDDYLRAMWEVHGRPGGEAPGLVARPYSMDDARDRLAEVTGDGDFASGFFARFVEGREVVDYARLLARAGLVLRPRAPARAWLGDLSLEYTGTGARIAAPVAFDTPAYAAGLAQDDALRSVDGVTLDTATRLVDVLDRRAPGDRVRVAFERRSGERVDVEVTLAADPALEIVTLERTGATPDADARRFREAWLSPAGATRP